MTQERAHRGGLRVGQLIRAGAGADVDDRVCPLPGLTDQRGQARVGPTDVPMCRYPMPMRSYVAVGTLPRKQKQSSPNQTRVIAGEARDLG